MTLKENLALLEFRLPELKAARNAGSLENDIYEAVDYLCHLGRRAIENDTRVNYPARAQTEEMLLKKLRECHLHGGTQDLARYLPLLNTAQEIIQQIANVPIPRDGHLGVLKAIREHFGFLIDEYGFRITDEQPTGIRLSSGPVLVEVGWATQSFLSFSLSREEGKRFWIDDLLYLHGDSRYSAVPQSLELVTEEDVNSWFGFVSGVLRKYGKEALADQPGAFDQLARAQSDRDAEFVAMMNRKSGRQNA